MMSDLGYDVLGFDLSAAMIELAERNAPRATFRSESLVDVVDPAVGRGHRDRRGAQLRDRSACRARRDGVASPDGSTTRSRPAGSSSSTSRRRAATSGQDVRERIHDDDDWMLCMRATESGDRLDRRITIYTREPDGRYARIDEHHVIHLYDPHALHRAARRHRLRGRDASELRRATARDSTPPMGWAVFVATKPTLD